MTEDVFPETYERGLAALDTAEREEKVLRVSRFSLIRSAIAFQIKLAFDGMRDLFLSPVCLVALVIDFLLPPTRNGRDGALRWLMRFGIATDRWIDLFGAYREERRQSDVLMPGGLDSLIERAENALREDDRTRKLTENARAALEQFLQDLQRQRTEK